MKKTILFCGTTCSHYPIPSCITRNDNPRHVLFNHLYIRHNCLESCLYNLTIISIIIILVTESKNLIPITELLGTLVQWANP